MATISMTSLNIGQCKYSLVVGQTHALPGILPHRKQATINSLCTQYQNLSKFYPYWSFKVKSTARYSGSYHFTIRLLPEKAGQVLVKTEYLILTKGCWPKIKRLCRLLSINIGTNKFNTPQPHSFNACQVCGHDFNNKFTYPYLEISKQCPCLQIRLLPCISIDFVQIGH